MKKITKILLRIYPHLPIWLVSGVLWFLYKLKIIQPAEPVSWYYNATPTTQYIIWDDQIYVIEDI